MSEQSYYIPAAGQVTRRNKDREPYRARGISVQYQSFATSNRCQASLTAKTGTTKFREFPDNRYRSLLSNAFIFSTCELERELLSLEPRSMTEFWMSNRNDEMKNTMCLALIILAVLPAYAQEAAGPNCPAHGETLTALAREYAARIDGLLREVHASQQNISAEVEAGRLTEEQARNLKLAATRDMISRLDTLSAVYDVRLSQKKAAQAESQPVAAIDGAADKLAALNANSTVSVEELKQEAACGCDAAR